MCACVYVDVRRFSQINYRDIIGRASGRERGPSDDPGRRRVVLLSREVSCEFLLSRCNFHRTRDIATARESRLLATETARGNLIFRRTQRT